MTFGFYYAGILTKSDVLRIIDALVRKGLTKAEIAERVGVSRGAIYQWISGEVSEVSHENKVRLLDLFYEVDKQHAIAFVEDILREHLELLEREKGVQTVKPGVKVEEVLAAYSPVTPL